jgi:hypothetical protein
VLHERSHVLASFAITHFLNADEAYRRHLGQHPDSYVVNTYDHVTQSYLKLHKTSCWTIQRAAAGDNATVYRKICAPSVADLRAWAAKDVGRAALDLCKHCMR